MLLAGLRDDSRFACSPVRTDLPPGAVAGVECDPVVGLVDQVGAYLFDSESALLKTYFDRLAKEDVKPRSGSCPTRAGEAAYVSGDKASDLDPHRAGCFVNRSGNANYRITFPDSLVYVGVLGSRGDLGKLRKWLWRGTDGERSAPSIWVHPPS
jgi:hypothetical protein